jgi:hypothetical protein
LVEQVQSRPEIGIEIRIMTHEGNVTRRVSRDRLHRDELEVVDPTRSVREL